MSIIDENIARIFLLATPLRDAVLETLDLDSTEKKIKQFETYAKSAWEKIVLESQDKSFLQEEIQWSFSQCEEYLELLKSADKVTEEFQFNIENMAAVLKLINKYRRILTDFILFKEHE